MPLGDYDSGGGSSSKIFGIYDVEVTKAEPRRNQDGTPEKSRQSGRVRFSIEAKIIGPYQGPQGQRAGEILKRTMDVAFGNNSKNGAPAVFASFVAWATGIPTGDPRQKMVEENQLVGTRGPVMIKHANGYNNIDEFLDRKAIGASPNVPPRGQISNAEAVRSQPATASSTTRTPATSVRDDVREGNDLLKSLNPGIRREIKARANAKRMTDSDLGNLIEWVTHGRARTIDDLTARDATHLISELKERAIA